MAATGDATCRVVRPTDTYEGKQGPTYAGGVSAESVGARAIWLGRATIPPGGRTRAHLHDGHESAFVVLGGECDLWFGEGLRQHATAGPGDYLYIPAGVPHVAVNRSQTEPFVAVGGRTDACEQESVVLLPDLDGAVPAAP